MTDTRQVAAEARDAFNAHDAARIRATYTDTIRFEAPGDVQLEDPDAATEYAMGWARAFPDSRIDVHNEIATDDSVVQEFTFEGTHDDTLVGPAGEIPATHRRLAGRGVQILRIENGKISEHRLYFDQVQVLTQLGLMPEPATA